MEIALKERAPRMTRRGFARAAAGAAALGCSPGQRSGESASLPLPTPAQAAWQGYELGIVFHYDLPVFAPDGWQPYRQAFDPNLYQPRKLDTDQWLEAAKAMGCGYAIFTATHFNGFLQWQSDLYPYGLRETNWRGGKADVFGDFVASCHKYGIAPGVYLSCHRNAYRGVWNYRVNWGEGGAEQGEFARLGVAMTEELASRYGPLCEIWYDAGLLHPDDGGPDVVPVVARHQPNTVFYHSPLRRDHRWIGNEEGIAGYPCWSTMPDLETSDRAHHAGSDLEQRELAKLLPHGDPNGTRWEPAMVDVPIRDHDWFWVPDRDEAVWSLDALVEMYYTSVGRNSTFILGGVPDRDGLIPDVDSERYAQLGKEIRRRFGQPVAHASGEGDVLELEFPAPTRIDHVSIMEEIDQGERIRSYVVDANTHADQWTQLCQGISVGHKRIERFSPVEAARIRLRCTEYAAMPRIRSLAAFGTDTA